MDQLTLGYISLAVTALLALGGGYLSIRVGQFTARLDRIAADVDKTREAIGRLESQHFGLTKELLSQQKPTKVEDVVHALSVFLGSVAALPGVQEPLRGIAATATEHWQRRTPSSPQAAATSQDARSATKSK